MKATFNQSPNVIQAAAERAGLNLLHSAQALPGWNGDVLITQGDPTTDPTIAKGTPNTIMRLIGALADDGQDCLVGVTQ